MPEKPQNGKLKYQVQLLAYPHCTHFVSIFLLLHHHLMGVLKEILSGKSAQPTFTLIFSCYDRFVSKGRAETLEISGHVSYEVMTPCPS